jgi:hypothetical protein
MMLELENVNWSSTLLIWLVITMPIIFLLMHWLWKRPHIIICSLARTYWCLGKESHAIRVLQGGIAMDSENLKIKTLLSRYQKLS